MHNDDSGDEGYITWDTTPEYAALLMAHSEDFSRIMQKVKFLQLEKEEAQKQASANIIQFLEKAIAYLKLNNVQIKFSEEM